MDFLRGFKLFFSKKPRTHSLACLNVAQFLGVINDNIFKLVLIFLLIDIQSAKEAPAILSAVGAVYVIPFLLFSAAAGVVADRFSKQRLLMAMKGAEILIMIAAMIVFGFKSGFWGYILLFSLSTHSALFGPSKYGIIPELVPKEAVARANGLITGFTYLAIIIGTFLASFLTDITGHSFVLVAGFCLLVALGGLISTFGIEPTKSQGSQKKITPFFISEIIRTLRFAREKKHLSPAIYGSSFFLFLGGFTQLNLIPYALQSLHLGEVAGGYLILTTALGIAFGSYVGGKGSKKQIALGLSCIALFAMALLFLAIGIFCTHLTQVVIFLILLGVFGGIFIVPLDSFIQLHSPDEKRGQVIAPANFLSFLGVLIASFALYFFSQILNLTSAQGFFVVGLIALLAAIAFSLRLSDNFLSYIAQKILNPFFSVQTINKDLLEKSSHVMLVLTNATWLRALLLLCIAPNIRLLIPYQNTRRFPWLNTLFYSVTLIQARSLREMIEKSRPLIKEEQQICLFADKTLQDTTYQRSFTDFFKFSYFPILFAHVDPHLFNTSITISKSPPEPSYTQTT